MDRRSFFRAALQAAGGIFLAGASFLTFKTNRFVSPISKEEGGLKNRFAQGTPPPPPPPDEYHPCYPEYTGSCSEGQTFICGGEYNGECKQEVICDETAGYNHIPCSVSSAYDPYCADKEGHVACPDTGTGATVADEWCPNH